MKLTYLSHSAFLLETSRHRLLFDPFLTGNPKAKAKPGDIQCDFILVTHGHNDHLGDAVSIAKKNNAAIISTFEVAMFCSSQGADVHPMGIGGAREFPFGRVKWTLAQHSAGYSDGKGFAYLGNPAGVLVTTEDKTIYHAGDTGLFLDMQLIGQLNRIDVALLPIGDNFTMGPDDAAKAVEFLKPGLAIPMHYGTFDLINADPAQFEARVKAAGFKARVLGVGESCEV